MPIHENKQPSKLWWLRKTKACFLFMLSAPCIQLTVEGSCHAWESIVVHPHEAHASSIPAALALNALPGSNTHISLVEASHMTTPSLNSSREVSFLLCSKREESSINASCIICDRDVFISLSYICSDLRWKMKANIMFLRGNQGSHMNEKKYISHSDLKFILK